MKKTTLVSVIGAAMSVALIGGCGRGSDSNTPSTDSAKAAPAAAAPAGRKFLLERVDDAAIVQLYADGFEVFV